MRAFVIVLLGCAACTGSAGGPSAESPQDNVESPATADGADGADGGAAGDSGGEDTAAPLASLSGRIVDPAGAPLTDVLVRLCGDGCRQTTPDDAGAFSYTALDPGLYSLHLASLSDPDRAWPSAVLRLEPGQERALAHPLVVAPFSTSARLDGPAPVEGDGLLIEADPASLDITGYAAWFEPVVQTRRVPADALGQLTLDGLEGSLLGAWELGTFDGTIASGWPVAIPTAQPPGSTLAWVAVDHASHTLRQTATLVVDSDGVARTTEGGPVHLTLGLLVAPPPER